MQEAIRLRQVLEIRATRNPSFWDSASLVDIDLVRLLIHYSDLPRDMQACRILVDDIIDRYQMAVQRGASPREQASVIENLDFLLEMVDQASSLHHDLRRIKAAVW